MILTYSSPSIEGDRLIYLTMETKIKPHTAGTISKSNVKIKVTSKEKKTFWPFIPTCERTHSTYLTVLVNYQSWPNLDLIYFVLQQ
jgi:hypothetical protein